MKPISFPSVADGTHRILAAMVLLLFIFSSLVLVLTDLSVQAEVLQNVEQVTDAEDEYSSDPHVIEDSQGQLAMAYRQTTSSDDTGDIWFVRTTDGESWGTPVQVTTSIKKDYGPSLAEGGNGKFYISFTTNRDGSWDVYFTKSTDYGQTWSTPTKLFGNYPDGDNAGGIAADGDNIWAIIREGGNPKMMISDDDGATWGQKNTISSSRAMHVASLLRNNDGELVTAFAHESDEKVRIRTSSTGTSWTEISATDMGVQPHYTNIAQDENDDYWLTFHDDASGDDDIYVTKSSDLITWSQVERLTDDDGADTMASVTRREGDLPKVCWASDRDGNNELFCGDVDYEEDTYEDFEDLLISHGYLIHDDSVENGQPSVIIDTEGKYSMAWTVVDDDVVDIYFSRSTDGTTWDLPIQVTTSDKSDSGPKLTEGASGDLYITVQSNRDDQGQGQSGDVYLTKSTNYGASWSTPSYVSGKYPHGEAPGGIVALSGNIWITHGENDGSSNPQRVVKSTDNGDTWDMYTITTSRSVSAGPLLLNDAGDLVAAVAMENDDTVQFFTSSTGESWSKVATKDFNLEPHHLELLQDDDGTYWLSTYSDPAGNDELYLAKSPDLLSWGGATQITDHAAFDNRHSMVMTGDEELHLFWASARSGDTQLFRGEVDHSQVADPQPIDDFDEGLISNGHPISDDDHLNHDPFTIIDSEGRFSMVWKQRVDGSDDAGDIFFSRSTDTHNWDTPVQVTTSVKRDTQAVLAEGDAGEFYIAFSSNRDTQEQGQSWDVYLTKSTDYGQTWSTPEYVAGSYPHGEGPGGIVVDGDNIYITHGHNDGSSNPLRVARSTDNGDSWSTHTITSSRMLNVAPLIMDSDGYLVVAVSLVSDEKVRFYRSLTGASWTNVHIEDFGVTPNHMDLIQDENGIYWLAFENDATSNDEVYIAKGSDLTSWGAATRITDNLASDSYASIVMTSDDDMHLFWESDRGGDEQIYAGEVDHASIPDPESELPKITLLAPSPATYTVEGGDPVSVDLTVQVTGDTVHNLLLNLLDDNGLDVDTGSPMTVVEVGESPTFTLSFTVPTDSTDDFQIVVNALCDEDISNQRTIHFEFEDEPEPEDISLILHEPPSNIKFARGGDEVAFHLPLEAVGGDVHSVFLYADAGGADDLEVQLPASITVIPAGTTQTVTVTFTMPADADSDSEYPVWVTATSTEDVSNSELLIVVYNPGDELSDPDSLPAPGLPVIMLGLSAAVVMATSFRNGRSQKP